MRADELDKFCAHILYTFNFFFFLSVLFTHRTAIHSFALTPHRNRKLARNCNGKSMAKTDLIIAIRVQFKRLEWCQ